MNTTSGIIANQPSYKSVYTTFSPGLELDVILTTIGLNPNIQTTIKYISQFIFNIAGNITTQTNDPIQGAKLSIYFAYDNYTIPYYPNGKYLITTYICSVL